MNIEWLFPLVVVVFFCSIIYYLFNICGVSDDVLSFTPEIDKFFNLSFVLGQPGWKFINCVYLYKELAFGHFDFIFGF